MSDFLFSGFSNPAISNLGVKFDRDSALIDSRDKILEIGKEIEMIIPGKDEIVKDRVGNIIRRIPGVSSRYSLKSFPIIDSPSDKQIDNAGLREKVTKIIYTSTLSWVELGFAYESIMRELDSIVLNFVIDGRKYEMKDKSFSSEFSDVNLYVVIGLNEV